MVMEEIEGRDAARAEAAVQAAGFTGLHRRFRAATAQRGAMTMGAAMDGKAEL
jgi:hypothetical protein